MIGWMRQLTAGEAPKPRTAPASLFVRDEQFGLSEMPFDLIIDESHRLEFNICDHAVENGETVSDHVGEKLRSVTVTGFFTNHPVGSQANATLNKDGEAVQRTDSIKISESDYIPTMNTALQRWEKLQQIARRRGKVRLVTALEVYEAMVVESLSANRSAGDGESIRFSLTLREMRTVKTRTETVSGTWNPPQPEKLDKPKKKAVSSKANNGTVQGQEAKAKEIAQKGAKMKGGKQITGA